MKTDTYKKSKSRFRAATVALVTGVLLMAAVPAAQAAVTSPFNPELYVPTDPVLPTPGDGFGMFIPVAYPDSTAGAHPDMVIGMRKPPNRCLGVSGGTTHCGALDAYIGQDLKKQVINFPPGFLPDANATPYCGIEQRWAWEMFLNSEPPSVESFVWFCDEASLVGTVKFDTSFCLREPDPLTPEMVTCNNFLDSEREKTMLVRDWPGSVYNARPRTEGPYAGEQGHLIVLAPTAPFFELMAEFGGWIRSDISIRVRDGENGDLGIDAIAEMIPDVIDVKRRDENGNLFGIPWLFASQLARLDMTLYGDTGADKGHPLLTNPTFCDPQTIDVLFQGYARNSAEPPSHINDPETEIFPGTGEGKIVEDSAPYTATNCDKVPYAPTFTASADSETPGARAALATVITQAEGEATTKKVHVTFPKGMGLNINSTLKPCNATDLAAKSCPESSRMGTVEAESRLLPISPPNNGPLKGNFYLTGQKGDKLTLSALFSGFIDLRLDAKAGVGADGTVTATFDGMPAMIYNKFTLNLFGGEKGLLTNPRACGKHTTTATFTSHSGKTHTVQSTSQVRGCDKPAFDVELSETGKGKRTSVELDVVSEGRSIKSVRFGLPRYLKWTTKRLGKRKKFGTVSFDVAGKQQATQLRLGQSLLKKRKKKKALKFGTLGALSKLKVSLYKKKVGTKKVKVRTKSGKKKTRKRSVIKSRLSLKPLPKDLDGVTVELNPSESRFLRNPKGCKKPLRFLAFVTTSDGKRHVLSQKIRLKGKGCSKKKKSKKKKKAKIAFTTLSGIWG